MRSSITILLPAHNEEGLLERTVRTILHKTLSSYKTRILIIENGSTDHTLKIAQKLTKNDRRISLIHRRKAGYGPALKAGILHAKSDIVVIFNVDYYDILFLKKALLKINKYDIISGSKTHPASKDKRPRWRQLVTRLFNIFLRTTFGYCGSDTHGMKVMRRSKILKLTRACQDFHWLFDTELILRAQQAGLRIHEVPVRIQEQRDPVSSLKGRFLRSIKEIMQFWWIVQREKSTSSHIISLLPLILFFAAFLTRFFLQEQFPHVFDSILYARGVDTFNIHRNEPAFPGYFLYILLGKSLAPFFTEPLRALTMLSVFFNALTVVGVFFLGRALFSIKTGVIASILFLTAGTVWFFGLVALPYTVSLFFHIVVAYGILRVIQGYRRSWIFVAGGLPLLIGIRPHELINIFLPFLYHLRFLDKRTLMRELSITLILSLSWIIPLLTLSGGVNNYWQSFLHNRANEFLTPSLKNSRFYASIIFSSFLASFTIALPLFFYPFIDILINGFRRAKSRIFFIGRRGRFLMLWITPMLLFQLIVKSDHPSHTLALILPFTLILAHIIVLFSENISSLPGRIRSSLVLTVLVGIIAVMNLFFFFRDNRTQNPRYITYSFIQANDRVFRKKLQYIRSAINPENSLIIGQRRVWRVVGYFLPEYTVMTFHDADHRGANYIKTMASIQNHRVKRWTRGASVYTIPENIQTIIFFDNNFSDWVQGEQKENVVLNSCCRITRIDSTAKGRLSIQYHDLKFTPAYLIQ